MSTRPPSSPNPDAERELESLLVDAGPREPLPQDALLRIRTAARESWSSSLHYEESAQAKAPRDPGPRTKNHGWQLALLAATVLLATALTYLLATRGPKESTSEAPVTIAVLESGALHSGLSSAGTLTAGATLESTDAGAALRFHDGKSVRLDRNTLLRAHSQTDLELVRGAVYIDNPPLAKESAALPSVMVRTPLGTATDIGTQFEVRLDESNADSAALVVRVREGAVRVRSAANGPDTSADIQAEAGQAVTLRGDGEHQVEPVATFGETWDWVLELAPFQTKASPGKLPSLHEVLSWACREAGWQLEYSDADARVKAQEIEAKLPSGLRPQSAALAALQASTLTGDRDGGTLRVSVRP